MYVLRRQHFFLPVTATGRSTDRCSVLERVAMPPNSSSGRARTPTSLSEWARTPTNRDYYIVVPGLCLFVFLSLFVSLSLSLFRSLVLSTPFLSLCYFLSLTCYACFSSTSLSLVHLPHAVSIYLLVLSCGCISLMFCRLVAH